MMNVIIHQFRKDVLRLRVHLIFWAVPLMAKVIDVLWGDDLRRLIPNYYINLSGLSPALPYLMVLIIVPTLIHEDDLVDTSAFWLTRPVSKGQLLGGKALFLGVMIVIMTIVNAIVLSSEGQLSSGEVYQSLLKGVLHLGTLALASVVTLTIGNYVLYWIGGVVTFWIGCFAADFLVTRIVGETNHLGGYFNPPLFMIGLNSFKDDYTIRSWLLLLVVLGGVIHQYATRRTKATIGLVVGGLFLLSLGLRIALN